MLTILQAIQLSSEYLEKKGIESSRSNAELLLADILKCTRLNLYLSFDKPLTDIETVKYREHIQRRGKFEPLQYITGKVEFYGKEFFVKPGVLIPRPETEFLIETVVKKTDKEKPLRLLDIGTGSGIIAVTLAKQLPNLHITAVDKTESVLECSRQNAIKNQAEQVVFKKIDILSEIETELLEKYEIIVSNPPYVSINEYETLQKEITDYEPKEAVTDFNDGYTFYKRIIDLSCNKLNSDGWLYMEMGAGQSAEIRLLMDKAGFTEIEIIKDLQGIDRIITGRKL